MEGSVTVRVFQPVTYSDKKYLDTGNIQGRWGAT